MSTPRHRAPTPNDLLALAETELSRASRWGQLTLLLLVVMASGVMGLLGATEPSLPPRARIVFAVIGALGVFSSAFGFRALISRRPLLAWHRVIACRIAVALAATIVLAASSIGFVKGIPSAFAVAAFGVILLGGTTALLLQENRKFAALTARRHALAEQLKART